MSAEEHFVELAGAVEALNMQLGETRNDLARVHAEVSELRQHATQAGAAGGRGGAEALVFLSMRLDIFAGGTSYTSWAGYVQAGVGARKAENVQLFPWAEGQKDTTTVAAQMAFRYAGAFEDAAKIYMSITLYTNGELRQIVKGCRVMGPRRRIKPQSDPSWRSRTSTTPLASPLKRCHLLLCTSVRCRARTTTTNAHQAYSGGEDVHAFSHGRKGKGRSRGAEANGKGTDEHGKGGGEGCFADEFH